jgi:hypothetical protein
MNTRRQLPLNEVEADARWRNVTPQQQLFIRILAETNDPAHAMRTAYDITAEDQATKGAYALMSRRNVRAVLDFMYQSTPQERLIDEIEVAQRSRGGEPLASRLKAILMKAQLMGIDLKMPEVRTPAEKTKKKVAEKESDVPEFSKTEVYKIGERVRFQGRLIRITGINELGRATDYELAEVPVEVR